MKEKYIFPNIAEYIWTVLSYMLIARYMYTNTLPHKPT